jgi:hypothetical protein
MVSFDIHILVYATLAAPLGKTHRARDLLVRGMRTGSSILVLQTLAEFSSVAIRKAGRGVDEVRTTVDAWRADFAYDHVVRYAVAYAARCTSTLGCVLLREPRAFRREATAIEAHSVEGVHMRTVRDVVWHDGRPYLRSPEKVETTDAGRFGGLLAEHVVEAAE